MVYFAVGALWYSPALFGNAFQRARNQLYLIDQGYHLAGFVLAGAILAYFAS